MHHEIMPNGNLAFILDADDDHEDVLAMRGYSWPDMLEACGLLGNGWNSVAPETIGALTDAPIVTDDWSITDEGETQALGRIWWFPNYQVEDPAETLVEKGRVVFTLARKVSS